MIPNKTKSQKKKFVFVVINQSPEGVFETFHVHVFPFNAQCTAHVVYVCVRVINIILSKNDRKTKL